MHRLELPPLHHHGQDTEILADRKKQSIDIQIPNHSEIKKTKTKNLSKASPMPFSPPMKRHRSSVVNSKGTNNSKALFKMHTLILDESEEKGTPEPSLAAKPSDIVDNAVNASVLEPGDAPNIPSFDSASTPVTVTMQGTNTTQNNDTQLAPSSADILLHSTDSYPGIPAVLPPYELQLQSYELETPESNQGTATNTTEDLTLQFLQEFEPNL